jgi:hypothetical protein
MPDTESPIAITGDLSIYWASINSWYITLLFSQIRCAEHKKSTDAQSTGTIQHDPVAQHNFRYAIIPNGVISMKNWFKTAAIPSGIALLAATMPMLAQAHDYLAIDQSTDPAWQSYAPYFPVRRIGHGWRHRVFGPPV